MFKEEGERRKEKGESSRSYSLTPAFKPGGLAIIILGVLLTACNGGRNQPVTLMVAEPGHFHAALVLQSMYRDVNHRVFVYAPEGPELTDFLSRVDGYEKRLENPVAWELNSYTGPDFFNRMLEEKPGNVLILAGNNQHKTEYIGKAIENGIHVYSDKPMAINSDDFTILENAFKTAGEKGLMLYDIMTERFEITSILQKELANNRDVFGDLVRGTPEDPTVIKESVHHFSKQVSGTQLIRPGWFFDVEQEGDGLTDVTTHLIDLVQWTCFPDQSIDYKKDIVVNSSRRWTTPIQPEQFAGVTGLPAYPAYLDKYVDQDSILQVGCNGEINYTVKGIPVRIRVTWQFQPESGGGDTHFSLMKGSLARLEIRQGAQQQYIPELYIMPDRDDQAYKDKIAETVNRLAKKYPGVAWEKEEGVYHILITDSLRVGHEAHFTQVTRNFLDYLENGNLPEWEVPNMLAKYWLTTTARAMAR